MVAKVRSLILDIASFQAAFNSHSTRNCEPVPLLSVFHDVALRLWKKECCYDLPESSGNARRRAFRSSCGSPAGSVGKFTGRIETSLGTFFVHLHVLEVIYRTRPWKQSWSVMEERKSPHCLGQMQEDFAQAHKVSLRGAPQGLRHAGHGPHMYSTAFLQKLALTESSIKMSSN